MKKFLVDYPSRINSRKKKLEKNLVVSISNRGKEFFIKGEGENEYLAEKVLKALDFGFPYEHAMAIKKDECEFSIINLKKNSKTKNLERTRGRIIGKDGSSFQKLSELTDCFFEIKDNYVGIIGRPEDIEYAGKSIQDLAKGTRHKNVYAFLEKLRAKKKIPDDMGLKDNFKN